MKSFPILAATILVLGLQPSFCQEPIIPSDALEQLQSIADRIRACEKEDITPVDPNSKARLPFIMFQDPPLNVTWDIKRGESLVKPFYGVIEFVTYSHLWAPDEYKRKNKRLADFIAQSNMKPDPLKHRYLFDFVHGNFTLATMTETVDSKEITEPITYRCPQLAAGVKKTE